MCCFGGFFVVNLSPNYCCSAPEHNMQVTPEREKEPVWKAVDFVSGPRSRNRSTNSFKTEAPKPVQTAESPLKQNGGHK